MWLTTDEDLADMYDHHANRNDILWCLGEAQGQSNVPVQSSGKKASRKRANPEGEDSKAPKSKPGTCASKVAEVEGIVKQLQDKHS